MPSASPGAPDLRQLVRGGVVAAALAASGLCASAPAFLEDFVDADDGHLDISNWLIDRQGFLPIPIVITEPAVGYGGGVALMFVRNSMRESAQKARETGHMSPPDIFVVGAAATENGTKAAFAGGMATFAEDRWRYRGGVGRADVNLAFYGIGGSGLGDGVQSLAYSLDGWMSSQQVLRRLGDSDNWLGLRWIFLDLDSKLDLSGDPRAGLRPDEAAQRASGLGLTLEHDSRDSIFTPSKGWTGALDAMFYAPGIGSDTRFESYRGHLFAYWPFARDFVLGGRLDGRSVSGTVPFYMLPFIDMRGIPAGRYQDEHTAVVETELRWNFTPRWAAVGFIGAGRAWGRSTDFGEASSAVSRGVGFRYQIAERLGMWVGLDYAKGPEDGTWYIQVGNAWR
ncbi:BamA/TamA family outer membrane protein [Variovorax sp. J22P271]|uniref:BamA/TamA family outer membrane protein n=1 Tax=Variovorax davisae TaxID=3053515 RepID=UPI002576F8FB|nr:BamA/TamA family outer membrane protein [Variovorax sp. J22P271]MDM0034411.1 BamA/TamA family outer membrane protein [Variovorax sp. J22P271]